MLFNATFTFISPLPAKLKGTLGLHSVRLSVRPLSVHIYLFTLASTNINQSTPNLVQMYMTIRSRMSWIMEMIGPELSKLSAFELENLPYLTLFTL